MISEKELTLLFETLLSSPGMNESVKVDFRLQRKYVLILVKAIETGLLGDAGKQVDGLMKVAGKDSQQEVLRIAGELLQKAGLSEMNEKLAALQLSKEGK